MFRCNHFSTKNKTDEYHFYAEEVQGQVRKGHVEQWRNVKMGHLRSVRGIQRATLFSRLKSESEIKKE